MRSFNICGYFRKRKYPQTIDGRKNYIQDALNPDTSIRKKNLISGLIFIAVVGAILIIIFISLMCTP